MVGIAQSVQSRQKKKRLNMAEKAREKTVEDSSASLCAENVVIRSEAGDMSLSSSGASHGVDVVSDIVFPGQLTTSRSMAAGVLAPNPKADLQQSSELLKRLNSAVDSSHSSTMIPMMVSDPHQLNTGDTTLISSALGATTVSITQLSKPPEEKFLSVERVSISDSSSSKIHPLMSTTTTIPTSVFNIEMLTTHSSGGSQTSGTDQSMDDHGQGEGGGLNTDKKSKGQSSYGLQTLSEICLNSSA